MHRKCKVVNICSSDYYAQKNMVDSCKCVDKAKATRDYKSRDHRVKEEDDTVKMTLRPAEAGNCLIMKKKDKCTTVWSNGLYKSLHIAHLK